MWPEPHLPISLKGHILRLVLTTPAGWPWPRGGAGGCPGRYSSICLARRPLAAAQPSQPLGRGGGGVLRRLPTSVHGPRGRPAGVAQHHSASRPHTALRHHQGVGLGTECQARQLPARPPPHEPAPEQQHLPWKRRAVRPTPPPPPVPPHPRPGWQQSLGRRSSRGLDLPALQLRELSRTWRVSTSPRGRPMATAQSAGPAPRKSMAPVGSRCCRPQGPGQGAGDRASGWGIPRGQGWGVCVGGKGSCPPRPSRKPPQVRGGGCRGRMSPSGAQSHSGML